MLNSFDREYYSKRVVEEETRAQRSTDAAVARIHRELASLYRARLEGRCDVVKSASSVD